MVLALCTRCASLVQDEVSHEFHSGDVGGGWTIRFNEYIHIATRAHYLEIMTILVADDVLAGDESNGSQRLTCILVDTVVCW